MNAEEIQGKHMIDTFIDSLQNAQVREHLLENKSLDLSTAYEQARMFKVAQKQSMLCLQSDTVVATTHPFYSAPLPYVYNSPNSSSLNSLQRIQDTPETSKLPCNPDSLTPFSHQEIWNTLEPQSCLTPPCVQIVNVTFVGLVDTLGLSALLEKLCATNVGNFSKVCGSSSKNKPANISFLAATMTVAPPNYLSKSVIQVKVN